MTIKTNGNWAAGCVHTIIDDKGRKPGGQTIATWLMSLPENEILEALLDEIRSGEMTERRAAATLNAYTMRLGDAA